MHHQGSPDDHAPAATADPDAHPVAAPSDEQVRRGIEAMYFAYRAFTSDPDLILDQIGYGRAHHRTLHFINREPGLTVTALLAVLGVTKQSLNRVLRALIEDGLVDSRVGSRDRRERQLCLTDKGAALERRLSQAQRARVRAAYHAAGPQAVEGFQLVLEAMMDAEMLARFHALSEPAPDRHRTAGTDPLPASERRTEAAE